MKKGSGFVELETEFNQSFVKARAVCQETGDDSTSAVAVEGFFREGVSAEDFQKESFFVLFRELCQAEVSELAKVLSGRRVVSRSASLGACVNRRQTHFSFSDLRQRRQVTDFRSGSSEQPRVLVRTCEKPRRLSMPQTIRARPRAPVIL
jgi:hypothetical protein